MAYTIRRRHNATVIAHCFGYQRRNCAGGAARLRCCKSGGIAARTSRANADETSYGLSAMMKAMKMKRRGAKRLCRWRRQRGNASKQHERGRIMKSSESENMAKYQ
jgi:hypothetical protein